MAFHKSEKDHNHTSFYLIISLLIQQGFTYERKEGIQINKLDVICLGLAALTTAIGLWRGLIRQIVTLMGIVVGYIISVNSYGKVAGIFSNTGNDTAKLLSFVLIFVSCIIIAYILGAIAGKILKITGLGWVDRIGGGFLGFLKGFIVIVIIVMFLSAFLPADNTLLKDSLSVHYVPSAASTMNKFIPYELLEKIRIKVDGIKEGAGHI